MEESWAIPLFLFLDDFFTIFIVFNHILDNILNDNWFDDLGLFNDGLLNFVVTIADVMEACEATETTARILRVRASSVVWLDAGGRLPTLIELVG